MSELTNTTLLIPQKRRKLKLQTILMLVNLVVLLLPLIGIYFFRIYENSLIRQTELELISQAAFVSSLYKKEISKHRDDALTEPYGIDVTNLPYIGNEEYYRPVIPQLSLSDSILPLRPKGTIHDAITVDAVALRAGEAVRGVLIDAQRTTLSGIKILDYKGTVISGRFEEGEDFSHIDEIQLALHGHYSSVIRKRISHSPKPALASISRGTDIRVFVALPIIHQDRLIGIAYMSRTPQNILKHLWAERNHVLMVGFLLLLITVTLAFFTSYTVAKPIHALIKQTRKALSDNTSDITPLKTPITKEIAELSESFSEMTQSLKQRSEYIKQFAMHVSHEFKTPLTAIQGAIELLQDHMDSMTPSERSKFLQNIEKDTHRLKLLVSKLLELARADMTEATNGECDVINLINELSLRYKDRGLNVHFTEHNHTPPLISIPHDALETILTNLLDNSLQHGAGEVSITINTSAQNRVMLYLLDDGKGISDANRDNIFTPFFTTNRTQGGTGLGLGIVESLLKTYHGTIRLGDSHSGAEFILELNCLMN